MVRPLFRSPRTRTSERTDRGRRWAVSAVAALLTAPVAAVATATVTAGPSSAAVPSTQTATFYCEGIQRTFTVPPLVTSLNISAQSGATVSGTLVVNPGETFLIDVGCRDGYGGYRGGQGGTGGGSVARNGKSGAGATTIRRNLVDPPVIVAGGDGGEGGKLEALVSQLSGGAGGQADAVAPGGNAANFNGQQGRGKDPFGNPAGGLGGLGGSAVGTAGDIGGSTLAFGGGGGGGGGGGYPNGGAGGQPGLAQAILIPFVNDCCAGGGGGAGDSYLAPEVTNRLIGTGAGFSVRISFQSVANSGPVQYDRCTDAVIDYVVPDIIQATKINVKAQGGEGFNYHNGAENSPSGAIDVTIDVTPGETLQAYVGCIGGNGAENKAGPGGFGIVSGGNGGGATNTARGGVGGGGASGIKRGNTVLTVAAGGGGDGGGSLLCTAGYGGFGDGNTYTPVQGGGQNGNCLGSGTGGAFASVAGNGGNGTAGQNNGGGGGGGGGGYPQSGAGGTGADNLIVFASGGGGGGGQSYTGGPGVRGSIVKPIDNSGGGFLIITPIYDLTIKVPQTITTAAFVSGIVGETYSPDATADSGLNVVFSIDPASAAVCSIFRGLVSFNAAGICNVWADQPGDDIYEPAARKIISTRVRIGQAITFEPPASALVGTSYTPTATSSSGLPVSFLVTPATASCSLANGVVTFNAVGLCQIRAFAARTDTYEAAQVFRTINVVTQQTQTITFTGPATGFVGGSYTPTATASSGLPVSFAVDPGSASVCSLSNGTLSFNTVGSCVVNANQAGDATYAAAAPVQVTTVVSKRSQTITFTGPATGLVGGSYAPSATASSGLPVSFAVDPASASVCALSNGVVSFTGTGSCVVNADQVGNATYSAALRVKVTTVVSKNAQTIAFTGPASAIIGDTYSPSATASSGLAVTFAVDPASASVCSLSNGVVSFIGAGSCVVNADQAGNGTYEAATRVKVTTVVSKKAQTVTFTGPATGLVGDSYSATATATSGLPVALSVDAASTPICSLVGTKVTFLSEGSCTLIASQTGDPTYAAATEVKVTTAISRRDQSITFTGPATGLVGESYSVVGAALPKIAALFAVAAPGSASSGLPVVFTVDATSVGCTLNGTIVTFVGAGICVINADQPGDVTFKPAPRIRVKTVISRRDQTVTFTGPATAFLGDSYTPTATSSAGLPVTFAVDPSSVGCSIAGGVVTFNTPGDCVIVSVQAGNVTFNPAPGVKVAIRAATIKPSLIVPPSAAAATATTVPSAAPTTTTPPTAAPTTVLPAEILATVPTAAPAKVATEVQGVAIGAPVAYTGSNNGQLLAFALVMLLVGTALVSVARTRRRV